MNRIQEIIARTPLFIRMASLYLVVGFIVVVYIQIPRFGGNSSNVAIRKIAPLVSMTVIDGYPDSFAMKRLNIDLPVRAGVYSKESNSWSLSDDSVYFATMSTLPNNQQGVTIIYGHNNDAVLSRLSENIELGETVSIATTNGHEFTYMYERYSIVDPSSTDILYYKSPYVPKLVVMTCDGLWSQARKLMYFNLVDSK